MARRNDEDDFDDDRPSRKRTKGGSGSGMSTGTVLLIVGAAALGVMVVCGGVLVALMLPAVQQAREAARSAQSKNNLKQIGLALHNYHDVFNGFPPARIVREDGITQLTWQASLLPYLEQAPLYDRIELGSDWDSPGNRAVRTVVIPTYLDPSVPETIAPDGLPASHYAGNSQFFKVNESQRLRDVTDGLSNTVMVGEVTTGLKSWGDPTNLRDPADGLGRTPTQFGLRPRSGSSGAHFLLGDGAVQFISEETDPQVLKALASPAGGESVPMF